MGIIRQKLLAKFGVIWVTSLHRKIIDNFGSYQ